jgi:hypothetical protein
MPLFLCFQSFGISYLEVGLSLIWEVLCLLQKDRIWIFFGIGKIATMEINKPVGAKFKTGK